MRISPRKKDVVVKGSAYADDIRNLTEMFSHGRTFAVCYVLAVCAHVRLTEHGTVTAYSNQEWSSRTCLKRTLSGPPYAFVCSSGERSRRRFAIKMIRRRLS